MRTWNNYEADDNTALQEAYERGFRDGYNFMALDEKDSDLFWDKCIIDGKGNYTLQASDRLDNLVYNFEYYLMARIVKSKADDDKGNYLLFRTIGDILKIFNVDMSDIYYMYKLSKLSTLQTFIQKFRKQHNSTGLDKASEREYIEYVKTYKEELLWFARSFVDDVLGSKNAEKITVGDVRKAIALLKADLGNGKEMRAVTRYCKNISDKSDIPILGEPMDTRKFRS